MMIYARGDDSNAIDSGKFELKLKERESEMLFLCDEKNASKLWSKIPLRRNWRSLLRSNLHQNYLYMLIVPCVI
jgi:hypothetical protein